MNGSFIPQLLPFSTNDSTETSPNPVHTEIDDDHVPAQEYINTHFSKRTTEIDASNQDLKGFVDFSAFTRLEVLKLDNNYEISLKVSNNRQLRYLSFNNSNV
jgi:hypothetical protein